MVSLTFLCFGLGLIAAVNSRMINCPTREQIGCYNPLPCPEDRPYVITSNIVYGEGLPICQGCPYCVASTETCPSFPCPSIQIPDGCIPQIFTAEIRVGGELCWRCEHIKC